MTDDPEDPKHPTLVSLSEKRKARSKAEDDEFLWGLAERLKARAQAAEGAGNLELAIEMRAASEAVHAADFLNLCSRRNGTRPRKWDKLKALKSEGGQ